MGPLVDVPAMIRIEDEHWVFERVEDGVLQNLTHRLIVHDSAGSTTIGATAGMETAMQEEKDANFGKQNRYDKADLEQFKLLKQHLGLSSKTPMKCA